MRATKNLQKLLFFADTKMIKFKFKISLEKNKMNFK